jgi:hypothetical protein
MKEQKRQKMEGRASEIRRRSYIACSKRWPRFRSLSIERLIGSPWGESLGGFVQFVQGYLPPIFVSFVTYFECKNTNRLILAVFSDYEYNYLRQGKVFLTIAHTL